MTTTRPGSTGRADDGVEGNSRLTSTLGLVLLVMLAVEGATVLDVRGMLTLHMYLGLMLIPPVLLKSATTFYRFARYYQGAEHYVRKGPPHIVLRMLGPLVVLSSLALLGTGVALILIGQGHRSTWLTWHKASFIVWFAVMVVHVLGHIFEASRTSYAEFRGELRRPGRAFRLIAVMLVLLGGVGLATALWPTARTTIRQDQGPDRSGAKGAPGQGRSTLRSPDQTRDCGLDKVRTINHWSASWSERLSIGCSQPAVPSSPQSCWSQEGC